MNTHSLEVTAFCASPCAADGEEGATESGGNARRGGGGSGGTGDPGATLECSTDAINIKKFDLAFAVDPLFHKTSAQFDAGGASGAASCVMTAMHLHDYVSIRCSIRLALDSMPVVPQSLPPA